ncbi:MAG: bifunctional 5,10-methylenetetrahydrofolate dehydrogenase/5,10-methenyltetrahydrofolate cyclohydrolase [bacterium]|nr:bifunctional 5,10-methylenetetrahydrofolate dehydrogenase/5,10-methenyltetrahydrofolate cyclohydrolase [bacterium]
MIIDCKKISQDIIERLKAQPKPTKFLAAVLVGKDASSISFLKQKEKIAKELGIDFRLYEFRDTIKNDELRDEVLKISKHKTCGGVIVQLPLPEHINKHYILNVIPREKDVDVLGERALGAFYTGRNPVLPPAVATLEEILKAKSYKLKASKVAVVGLGFLVGKPISVWLEGNPVKNVKFASQITSHGARCKEILLFDEGSDFLLLREADLVISGVGKAGIIKPEMLKSEAVVIDFGYSQEVTGEVGHETRKSSGDFDSSVHNSAFIIQHSISYTPTPGGTGPILVAKLLENFYKLTKC